MMTICADFILLQPRTSTFMTVPSLVFSPKLLVLLIQPSLVYVLQR